MTDHCFVGRRDCNHWEYRLAWRLYNVQNVTSCHEIRAQSDRTTPVSSHCVAARAKHASPCSCVFCRHVDASSDLVFYFYRVLLRILVYAFRPTCVVGEVFEHVWISSSSASAWDTFIRARWSKHPKIECNETIASCDRRGSSRIQFLFQLSFNL